MAFLDNSGDIILDAVLTDTGRFRLAKGDGSFKIVKFSLSDDEINYSLYNKNHASGSAYYDLEIMQSPVFEAFTNNASTMKYKLLTIPRTNLLYLPEMKICDKAQTNSETNSNNTGYAVAVTDKTYQKFGTSLDGVMNGEAPVGTNQRIRVDQGLNTDEISWQFTIDQDLKETQFIVEMDNRLGTLANPTNAANASVSFIDDDNIASYFFSLGTDPGYVEDIKSINPKQWTTPDANAGTLPSDYAVIKGPQGTAVMFVIKSSIELISSNFLFDQLGDNLPSADETSWGLEDKDYKYIDTVVKVTGATTGYRIDIPVRFIKCTNC